MTMQRLHLLHIEDDRIHQELVAHHLASMPEYQFDIEIATSEDAALTAFAGRPYDLVILDYHLTQGDGLSCLRRMRETDSIVPIIAISGVATNEIAAELIEAGADDYLEKKGMEEQTLCRSVRNVLIRAQAFQSRFSAFGRRAAKSAAI